MIKISKQQLEKIKPGINRVVIKPEKITNNEEITKSGILILNPDGMSPSEHVGVWGTVIAVPDKLFYDQEDVGCQVSMPWETNMQVKVGDHVMYNYHGALQALGKLADPNPMNNDARATYFECEGEIYFSLKYMELILVKSEDIITMLNGYCLCEPIEDDVIINRLEKAGIIIPETLKGRPNTKIAKVVYIGERNKRYTQEVYWDGLDVKVGDTIVYEANNNISPEWGLYTKLNKEYYRMQRKDMMAIIEREGERCLPEEENQLFDLIVANEKIEELGKRLISENWLIDKSSWKNDKDMQFYKGMYATLRVAQSLNISPDVSDILSKIGLDLTFIMQTIIERDERHGI